MQQDIPEIQTLQQSASPVQGNSNTLTNSGHDSIVTNISGMSEQEKAIEALKIFAMDIPRQNRESVREIKPMVCWCCGIVSILVISSLVLSTAFLAYRLVVIEEYILEVKKTVDNTHKRVSDIRKIAGELDDASEDGKKRRK